MARGVNKVILVGNLGKDPEVRYSPNGSAVANCTLATTESWKDKTSGEKQEKTEWHRVVFFGRLAEIAGEYLKKGSQVFVEGRLQTRKWQDKDGQDRYTTEIVAGEMPAGPRVAARGRPRALRRELGGRAREPGDLDGRVDEVLAAGTAAGQLGESPREAADHPRAHQRPEAGHDPRVGGAGEDARPRLPDLVARRGRRHRRQLDPQIVVADPGGECEGIGVGVVHPPLHRPFVAVPPLEIRRAHAAHFVAYFSGFLSKVSWQERAQK